MHDRAVVAPGIRESSSNLIANLRVPVSGRITAWIEIERLARVERALAGELRQLRARGRRRRGGAGSAGGDSRPSPPSAVTATVRRARKEFMYRPLTIERTEVSGFLR